MAPNYNRSQNRRQNRTVDHDIYEGLPVRQWRRDYVTVVPPPAQENNASQNDVWGVELPWGMPRDHQMLPQHSQDLLRAARSGRIYKRPAPVEEEEADIEPMLGEKSDKKDDDVKDKGFTAKAWKQIPRQMEGPNLEYLAKRRKGLVTVTSKPTSTGPVLTKAMVKRTDAAGNEYVQSVVVPQGQAVDGEVISQTTITGPALGDGSLAPVPTPPKRKGVPKGKKKGPGRGKKKVLPPTSVPQTLQVTGVGPNSTGTNIPVDGVYVKKENEMTPTPNEDTPIADGSTHDSDDEEGDDGDEGDDDDEGSVDNQGSPSKPPRPLSTPPPNSLPVSQPDIEMSGTEAHPMPPPFLHIEQIPDLKSGSPLKHVALSNSTINSPLESPKDAIPAPFPDLAHSPVSQVPEVSEPTTLNEVMQQEVAETAPPILPSPPPDPTIVEVAAAVEVLQEEEEEEEMLLDIIENAENANVGVSEAVSEIIDAPLPVTELELPETTEAQMEQPNIQAVEETPIEVIVQAEEEDDDDFPDLLGGLEKQLNEPAVVEKQLSLEPVSEEKNENA